MRESSHIVLIVTLIAMLLLASAVTGNRWPSPSFIALILAGWLAYMLWRRPH